MDELARQSTATVSLGRRRLKIVILAVAGISVVLILGALGYLVYNTVRNYILLHFAFHTYVINCNFIAAVNICNFQMKNSQLGGSNACLQLLLSKNKES